MSCNCEKMCGRSGCCGGCIDRYHCEYVCEVCVPKPTEKKPEDQENTKK